jgi:hypothetical protein
MDQGSGGLEEDRHITNTRKLWGLRPWKRHSTILLVAGFLYVLIGIQYIVAEPSEGRNRALAVILQVAPIHIWGGLFFTAGLLAMISSRWPPTTHVWGYMVLTGLSSGWGATYATGLIFSHAPPTNIGQSIVWGVLAFMWWAISGLPNPVAMEEDSNGRS